MASDLISRSNLLARMCQENCGERQCVDAMDRCVWYYYIKQQPTVDAAPVVHGEWEVCGEDLNGKVIYKCSNCGDELVTLCGFEIDWNYCPNCGADMRVGRWKGEGMGDYSCSLCGEVVNGNHREECPNCHAKMDGGDKE